MRNTAKELLISLTLQFFFNKIIQITLNSQIGGNPANLICVKRSTEPATTVEC